jgi:hypothetical protein
MNNPLNSSTLHETLGKDVQIGDDEISQNFVNRYKPSQGNQMILTVFSVFAVFGETRIIDFRKVKQSASHSFYSFQTFSLFNIHS